MRIYISAQICPYLRRFPAPRCSPQSNVSGGLEQSCCLASKTRFFLLVWAHRNYHVFYYLLLGVSEEERQEFQLKQPGDYFYLNQVTTPNPSHKHSLCSPRAVYAPPGGQRLSAQALSGPQTDSDDAQRRQHKGAHSFPVARALAPRVQPKSFSRAALP